MVHDHTINHKNAKEALKKQAFENHIIACSLTSS